MRHTIFGNLSNEDCELGQTKKIDNKGDSLLIRSKHAQLSDSNLAPSGSARWGGGSIINMIGGLATLRAVLKRNILV